MARSQADQARVDPDLVLPVPGQPVSTPSVLLAVAIGGIIGTLARYVLGRWFPTDGLPTTTIAINVVGAFALGFLATGLDAHPSPLRRAFVGVGILGGFTTFSTFTVDADRLTDGGDPWLALGSIAITLVLGIVGAAAGLAVSQTRALRHDRP